MNHSQLHANRYVQKACMTLVIVGLIFGPFVSFAWLGPASNPPAGNVPARVDTSSYQQTKVGSLYVSGTLGIGTVSPDASALLDVSSVSQGVLFPRLSTSQLNAVSSPTAGLMAFNASTQQLNSYTTSWNAVGGSGGGVWTATGTQLYYTGGNVGIGDTAPAKALSVNGTISAPASSTVRIKASGPVTGNGNNSSIYFLDSTGTTRARFDTTTLGSSKVNLGWWKMDEASGNTVADSSGNGNTGIVGPNVAWLTMDEASGNTAADSSGKANTATGAVNTMGLHGWWKMDEASGTALSDSSGYGNTMTATGYTAVVAGKYSNARAFNGTTSYLTNSAPSSLPTGSVVSAEAWIYPTGFPDATYNGIVSWGPRTCTGTSFLFSIRNNGQLSFASWCNDAYQTVGSTVPLNTWTHVAVTLSGTSVVFYINGVAQQTVALGSTPNIQSGILNIGATDNPGRYFQGYIDDVRIYASTLNQDQVQADMGDNLYYQGPPIVAGKYGNARSFNGFNYMNVPNAASLNVSSQVTLEAWVYMNSLGSHWIMGKEPVNSSYELFAEGTYFVMRVNDCSTGCHNAAGGTQVANTWTHVAGTYDGTNIKLYVNGSLVATTAYAASIATNANALQIGAFSSGGAYQMNGLIDDVKIYNTALSQTAIQNDMNDSTEKGVAIVAGKYGNARNFLETGGVNANLGTYFGGNNPLSVEAWVNVTASANGPIFGVTTSPVSWNMPFLSINGTTLYGWIYNVNGNVPLSYVTTVGWHHLALTYDPAGSGTEYFYVDGVQVGSGTGQYSPSGVVDYWSTYIPGTKPAGVNSFLNATIDDVRTYNYPLTQAAIQSDMNNGAPVGNAAYGTMYVGVANTTAQDLAEWYDASDPTLAPGMLVSLDKAGKLIKAFSADSSLLGVISTNPGVTLGTQDTGSNAGQQKVALSGKVPTLVNTTNGPIQPGDLITVDPQHPGQGTKLMSSGWYVGRALQPLTQGAGSVEVFANAGYWNDPSQNQSIQSSVQSIFASVLKKAGVFADASGLHFDSLVGDVMHAGILKAPHLDLIDSATGDLYCVTIQNGQLNKVKQACQ